MSFGPLYAIDHPSQLAGFVVGGLAAVVCRGIGQSRIAAALGDATGVRAGRGGVDLRKQLEVYGVVAWALGGIGWGLPLRLGWRADKRQRILSALAGIAAIVVPLLAAVALARAAGSTAANPFAVSSFTNAGDPNLPQGTQFAYTAALVLAGMAILDCIPVPPLDGWPLLRALVKVSPGLERARYQLEDRNLGLVIAFVFAALPRLFTSLPDPVFNLAAHLVKALLQAFGG